VKHKPVKLRYMDTLRQATTENLLDRLACLRRADLDPDANAAIVRGQLWAVQVELCRRGHSY